MGVIRRTKRYKVRSRVVCIVSIGLLAIGHLRYAAVRRKTVVVVFQSKAEWFQVIIAALLTRAFPGRHIVYYDSTATLPKYDLVVESVPTFQNLETAPCKVQTGPWIQVVGEASVHYNDSAWCPHDRHALARLDTSLVAIQHSNTVLKLWSPYACNFILGYKGQVHAPAHLSRTLYYSRPYTLAWISSNCINFRVQMWKAIKKKADMVHLEGVHSLGGCENNFQLVQNTSWTSNAHVYKDYKFVLVMENVLEEGYVTEKIATALAAGAVPIYFGDDAAAKSIFGGSNFISLASLLKVPAPSLDSNVIIELAATEVVNMMTNHTKLMQHLRTQHLQHSDATEQRNVFPPECVLHAKSRRKAHDGVSWQADFIPLLQALRRAVK